MMNRKQLTRIELILQKIDTALIVRDPGSARSSEAFDGLRKIMIQAGTSHRAHAAHLLSLSDSLDRGASVDLIRDRVNEYLLELGITRSTDIGNVDFFEVAPGEGDTLVCEIPAVVQRLSDGRIVLVRPGKARRERGRVPQESADLRFAQTRVTVDETQTGPNQASLPDVSDYE